MRTIFFFRESSVYGMREALTRIEKFYLEDYDKMKIWKLRCAGINGRGPSHVFPERLGTSQQCNQWTTQISLTYMISILKLFYKCLFQRNTSLLLFSQMLKSRTSANLNTN